VTVDGKPGIFGANTELTDHSMWAEIFIKPGTPKASMTISCKVDPDAEKGPRGTGDPYNCVVMDGDTTVQMPGSIRVERDLQGGDIAPAMAMPSADGTAVVLKFDPRWGIAEGIAPRFGI